MKVFLVVILIIVGGFFIWQVALFVRDFIKFLKKKKEKKQQKNDATDKDKNVSDDNADRKE